MNQTPIKLGALMVAKGGSINPSNFPEEHFDLYSIPAFDSGEPELVPGNAIGSAKQVVKSGDVLLSKIVPHIRRSWVVGEDQGRRIIASGEWIVFRNESADPKYLRHFLVGDQFHAQFMRTVSGVGGSLLRARPAHVANIPIKLPPLSEQRRIAEILDKAEGLRAKRRAALAELDTLTQSIFLEMFGDPAKNPKGWERCTLAELILEGPKNGLYKPASDYGSGARILRIDAFYDGVVDDFSKLKRVRLSEAEISQYRLSENDIVINRVNSLEYLGKCALIPSLTENTVFESNMMRFQVRSDKLSSVFLIQFLQSAFIKTQIQKMAKHAVNQASINQGDVMRFQVNLPPISVQQEFARRAAAVERLKAAQRKSLAEMDALFASLQHRAFRGEL